MVCRSVAVLALILSASVATADDFEVRHITTFGTATIQVAPDQMKWRLKVRNVDPNSAKAAAEGHGALVAAVLEYLEQNHISEQTIQTSGMRLGEVWENEYGKRELKGVFASTEVSFTLSDLAQYPSIWIGISGLPAVSVLGVDMDHTERIRFQNEARVKAVLAAKEKAEAIAFTLGVHIGGPLMVEEDLSMNKSVRAGGSVFSNSISFTGENGGVEGFVAPGYIPISVRVKGAFELLNRE